jgi:two-component system alkaline phosphatase synthesis response regulator PhoP
MSSTIFVVEDDPNIAHVMKLALSNSGFEVSIFSHAMDLYLALETKRPKLFILDLMLPDIDGIAIIQTLKKKPAYALIPVLIVSAKSTELDKVIGLDVGADDYLVKPFGVLELISRVKAILRRSEVHAEDEFLFFSGLSLDPKSYVCKYEEQVIQLTAKEFALLRTLMQHNNETLSREELLNQVWGYEFIGESRTLDVHIKEVRQKIGAAGASTDLIQTVRGVGYKFVG